MQGKIKEAKQFAHRALKHVRAGTPQWRRLQDNGMAIDYSWKQRARTYGDLYQRILKERDQQQLD